MEENNEMKEVQETNKPNIKNITIIVIVLLVIVLIGGYFVFFNKSEDKTNKPNQNEQENINKEDPKEKLDLNEKDDIEIININDPLIKDLVFVYDYMPDIVELPSSNEKPNDYIFEEKWTGDYDTLFNKVVSNNKSKTYKYTFKKQSNGNYYFVSGEVLQ